MAYRVKLEVLDEFPQLFTIVKVGNSFKRVTLHGKPETVTVDATAARPKQQVVIPVATQSDLKILFEEKHPFIEEFDAKEEQAVAAAK